jgi:adenylate cyclase
VADAETTPELRRVPVGRRLAWGAVAGVAFGVLAFFLGRFEFFQGMEAQTQDARQKVLARPTSGMDSVAIILVDELSAANLAKDGILYPWPRDVYAGILQFLKSAGAKAILFDLFFFEYHRSKTDKDLADAAADAGMLSFAAKLDFLPPDPEREGQAIEKAKVPVRGWTFPSRAPFTTILSPIPEFIAAAQGLGTANGVQDPDNTVRRVDLLNTYPDPGSHVGSLAYEAVRYVVGRNQEAALKGRQLTFGDHSIPLGADGRMLLRFYGKEHTLQSYNAYSILQSQVAIDEGKAPGVDPARFKDRVVFIGANFAGHEDVATVPVSVRMPGVEVWATACANILEGRCLRELLPALRLGWIAGVGLLAGIVAFGLWRPLPAGAGMLVLLGSMIAAGFLAFDRGLVLDLFFPAVAAGATYLSAMVYGYVKEGRQKRQVSKAFGQYLSPEVIRDLMRNPEALKLGGETREVTVYFSDIRGFSTFSEGMTPAQLVSFLNVYLSTMTDVILDSRGVIDKYEGDAIMAFWGAPVPLEGHALKACHAVLAQRRALVALNERFQAEGRPRLEFRAGLNSGPAVVGNMGSNRRFAYTAMGDTVNLASRLEGANKFFGTNVMMSEAVYQSAGDGIAARRLGRLLVVGKKVPTMVYELLARKEDLAREELDRLGRYHHALERLEAGAPAEAAGLFRDLLAERADPVVDLCLKKCEEMQASGESWDGVWVLTAKG